MIQFTPNTRVSQRAFTIYNLLLGYKYVSRLIQKIFKFVLLILEYKSVINHCMHQLRSSKPAPLALPILSW